MYANIIFPIKTPPQTFMILHMYVCRIHSYVHMYTYSLHRWELPGNSPVFTMLMVIYHYVERIWRILVTPDFSYNI